MEGVSFKEEGDSDRCYTMDEPCGHYAFEINLSQKNQHSDYTDTWSLQWLDSETGSRWWVPVAGRVGIGCVFKGDRVSVWEDETSSRWTVGLVLQHECA